MDNISQSSQLDNNIISEGNILRCPQCHLIPFIFIEQFKTDSYLIFECLNNHKIRRPLKELYNENKNFKIDSVRCKNCEETNISKIFYCIKCYGFYCEKELHSLNEGHDILIPVKKIDSCCFEKNHNNNNTICYCKDDNKNICFYCKENEHKGHKIEEFKFIENERINEIKNNINKTKQNLNLFLNEIKSFILELEKLIKEIKNEYNKYKENNEIKIKIVEDLINNYEMKKTNCDLNYQIIQNINYINFNNDMNIKINLNKIDEIRKDLLNKFEINMIKWSKWLLRYIIILII